MLEWETRVVFLDFFLLESWDRGGAEEGRALRSSPSEGTRDGYRFADLSKETFATGKITKLV